MGVIEAKLLVDHCETFTSQIFKYQIICVHSGSVASVVIRFSCHLDADQIQQTTLFSLPGSDSCTIANWQQQLIYFWQNFLINYNFFREKGEFFVYHIKFFDVQQWFHNKRLHWWMWTRWKCGWNTQNIATKILCFSNSIVDWKSFEFYSSVVLALLN